MQGREKRKRRNLTAADYNLLRNEDITILTNYIPGKKVNFVLFIPALCRNLLGLVKLT